MSANLAKLGGRHVGARLLPIVRSTMKRTLQLVGIVGMLAASPASATILWWEAGNPALTHVGWLNHLLQVLGLA